jgi:hypothetical protein
MPSPRGFSLLLTASQAAARIGVPIQIVLGWAAEGELRIAGQDEDGRALFREAAIASRGKELAEAYRAKPRPPQQTHNVVGTLPCGCDLERSHPRLCRDALALNTALQFAELLTLVMPDDPLPRRLAEACDDALSRHLTGPLPKRQAPALQAEVAAGVDRLESRDPALRTKPANEEAHA